MPRKPAPLERVGGKGPRQRIWDLIRARRDGFAAAEVTPGDVPAATARTYLQSLLAGGYIALVGELVRFEACRWRLVVDAGIEAPRVRKDGTPVTMGLAQEQMWRTLRMLKGDTNARVLAAHASTATVPVRESAAADYINNLAHAGYMECTRPHQPGRVGRARYRLINNTGPLPPMVCRVHAIYDPNLGRIVWHDENVTEEDAIYAK